MLPDDRAVRGRASATLTAQHLGFRLPIAGLAGDQQSALFGQGCRAPGMAKNTYGTGAFLLVHAGTALPEPAAGLLATAACGPRGEPAYALEGSVFIAGAAIQWLRDGLGIIATAAETRGARQSVADTGGVNFVPAFVGLGTPHWEAEARGTITGITRGTTRAHLVRAALEAIAFGSADLLRAMIGVGCARGAGAPGGRRRRGQRLAHAVPGRRARRAGRAARHGGDDRARRGGAGGHRHRRLVVRDELRGGVAVRRFEPASVARERARRMARGSARFTRPSPGPATAASA